MAKHVTILGIKDWAHGRLKGTREDYWENNTPTEKLPFLQPVVNVEGTNLAMIMKDGKSC